MISPAVFTFLWSFGELCVFSHIVETVAFETLVRWKQSNMWLN